MNNYKTYYLIVFFLGFISLANSNEGFTTKVEMEYALQDTLLKKRTRSVENDKTNKEQPKTDKRGIIGIIKSVPRARKQAKPNIVKPKIDIIRGVKPIIKPKIGVPVRVKVKI